MFELCASILSANFAELATDLRLAEESGADAFHIDVMDGHFVPAISFGGCIVKATKRSTKLPLDVHLSGRFCCRNNLRTTDRPSCSCLPRKAACESSSACLPRPSCTIFQHGFRLLPERQTKYPLWST